MKKNLIVAILFCSIIGMAFCSNLEANPQTIKIELTQDGEVYVQGKQSSFSKLQQTIEKEMNTISNPDEFGDCVILKAHETVKMELLDKVKIALRNAKIKKINYSTYKGVGK